MNYFSKNLLFLRKRNDVTQAELALQLNNGQSTIAGWESGNYEPKLSEILIISRFFDISLDDLIKADLKNGNLKGGQKVEENGNVNGNVNGNLIDPQTPNSGSEPLPESGVNEEDKLSAWVVLKQLRDIEGKIDQLLNTKDNETKK